MFPEPLPEAYSRVTNPARFSGLHNIADEIIAQLHSEFDVEVSEEAASAVVLRHVSNLTISKSIKLKPRPDDAAPIHITFTDFPALIVEFGQGIITAYPSCGCDACAETYEGEASRFTSMVDSVVEGRFREEISGIFRRWHRHEFVDASGNIVEGGATSVPIHERSFFTKRRRVWKSWSRRSTTQISIHNKSSRH